MGVESRASSWSHSGYSQPARWLPPPQRTLWVTATGQATIRLPGAEDKKLKQQRRSREASTSADARRILTPVFAAWRRRTVYESSCSTKYVEKQPGKFVGDTACEKLPVEICGAGCTYEEGEKECHDKVVATLVDVPEEQC